MNIRPATPADAPQMVALLNAIVAKGGTTAHQRPFDEARMVAHYIASPFSLCCHVAEEEGRILGFQALDWPDPAYGPAPEGWGFIATFVDGEAAGKGVGRALFEATREAARKAGMVAIDATIRADNASGLGYYSKMGFVDYDRATGVPLRDGTKVDRIMKRYDL